MTIRELVIEMKLLERRLTLYEEKYGVLSEDFYTALMSGSLAEYNEYDETRTDFSQWKGIYSKLRSNPPQKKLPKRLKADATMMEPIKSIFISNSLNRHSNCRIKSLDCTSFS